MADAERIFSEQCNRCGVDYFDFYLLQASIPSTTMKKTFMRNPACWTICWNRRPPDGSATSAFLSTAHRIHSITYFRNGIGISVQIQLNYLDWDARNARRLYESADAKGVQCIIMEPVKGGTLVSPVRRIGENPQGGGSSAFDGFLGDPVRSLPAKCPDRPQWNDDNGTGNRQPLRQSATSHPLTDGEALILKKAVSAYLEKGPIPCTGCRYCMDCPSGVDIPKIFSVYNACAVSGNLPIATGRDGEDLAAKAKAFSTPMPKSRKTPKRTTALAALPVNSTVRRELKFTIACLISARWLPAFNLLKGIEGLLCGFLRENSRRVRTRRLFCFTG